MMLYDREILTPFILSWSLRNSNYDQGAVSSDAPAITGICSGIYPIDGWKPLYLEIPRESRKMDISGRSNNASGPESKETRFSLKRTVNLPVFSNTSDYDIDKMRILIKHWCDIGIPEDIPCISIAIKCRGFYSDYREAQYVTVLVIWNDGVSRILSLDWCEGPLEDCITPEWYVETTPLMHLREAINRMENIYANTQWDNPSFSLYTIPSCLCSTLRGDMAEAPYVPWSQEWNYSNHVDLHEDLNRLLFQIRGCFSPVEVD
jgi:hypothetical protein